MPVCRKCGKHFPNRLNVNGEIKNAQNRKYCLECSPYGEHNTKKIHIFPEQQRGSETRTCPRCKQSKSRLEFYDRRKTEGASVYCKKCTGLQTIERQQEFKKKCVEYKSNRCSVCGYDKYFGALEFHHLDPSKKDFSLAHVRLTAFNAKVKIELDKCILLCSNCHRELHAKLKGII